ncbi:MAG: ABC transporter ATP-binding protein [Deltaproteobacteria bacterium]|nr:ABC transporter ATP-binding protein [Deltaproteobacteria bacterium]
MLEVEQVESAYGKVKALFGVSLTIREKEMVALIGANGGGKSTTLKTILGLVPLASGTIRFLGKKIDGLPSRAIVKMGISLCPEGRKLWPDMTVRENLELGAFCRGDREVCRKDLKKIFDTFPILRERQDQMAGSLSGGEQQMAAIGRALMANPRLLMLDEPSLGLSPIIVEKMSQRICQIHASGTTVLLVEQNAFLALQMSDRSYVLEVGRVAIEGNSSELMQNEHVRKAYLGKKVAAKLQKAD